MWNWIQIHSRGDLAFLIARKRFFKADDAALVKHWHKLYDEFTARFGMSPAFADYLKKMRRKVILTCENAIEFDTVKDLELQILEKEMKMFTDKGESVDFYASNATLEKFMGFRINPKKTSVAEYYGMIKLMQKAVEDMKSKKPASQQAF